MSFFSRYETDAMDLEGYEVAEGKVAGEGSPTYYYGRGHSGQYYRVRSFDESGEEVSKEEKVDCGRSQAKVDIDRLSGSFSEEEEEETR